MAILHPLECYLLEQFSSPEHFALTRDAIIEWVNAHEAAYARYQQELPLRSRKDPLWKQGDVVWGTRVLPNIRPDVDRYIQAYILRIHHDPEAFFKVGHTMSGNIRGIREFWDGWMTEEELMRLGRAEYRASQLDDALTNTVDGMWCEGDLTYFQGDLYQLSDLPKRIPRYVLDNDVRIEKGALPIVTGIYLPDVESAPAQLLYPGAKFGKPPTCRQGVARKNTVNPDTGKINYNWKETCWAETGWTLIRRVEGEYLDVPPGGFFPKCTPEELYNWPAREADYLSRGREYITAWTGEAASHAGQWSTFTGNEMQHAMLAAGESLPPIRDKENSALRACWTLVSRADGGSVFK